MIYSALKAAADRFPDKTAIIVGNTSVSYRELLERISVFTGVLQNAGIRQGDAVAILLPNGIDFAVTTFATFALNAVAVPINTRFQADEIKYYLDTSGSKLVVHTASTADVLAATAPQLPRIDAGSVASAGEAGFLQQNAAPGTPAVYMYSSGSTGKSKRVTRTQGNLAAEYEALAATIGLTEQDRILCTVPLYHAHGFGNCLFAALLSGGTLVILEGEFNPRETAKQIAAQGITIYPAVPFMYKMMAEAFFASKPDLGSVRLFFSAGAALPLDVVRRFREVFAATIRQLYGSTETGAVAINFDGPDGAEESVGRPLVGVTVDILSEEGEPLPTGQMGEVAIKSPAMTAQYDGLPETTAECFRGGYFLPGDLGVKDDTGRISIKGRKKLLINVAGNKVDPLDVESVIKTDARVKDVVVLGRPHSNYGEMVKAVVVAEPGCTEQEIIDLCGRQLAWYKVPKVVEFRSEIPRSPLGKILRKYLQDETA
jgi:long-chain acyl-CoA synthetase